MILVACDRVDRNYMLAMMFNMSHIIEFHELNINLIYAYAIKFPIRSNIGLYFSLFIN